MRGLDDVTETVPRLALLLAGVALLRIVGAVIAGFVALSANGRGDFVSGRQHAASVLTLFGNAGDTLDALLLVTAAFLLWWTAAHPAGMAVVRLLVVAVMVLIVLRVIGVLLVVTGNGFGEASSEEVLGTTFGVADLLLCAGAFVLPSRLPADGGRDEATDTEPLVFAVDKGNGEVFAFFSYAEAARTLSVYSIADAEFDFYTDEGLVVDATVADDRPRFDVTGENRRDALLAALRGFAAARGLDVDPPGDPEAYAIPVSDWQWLELWPGWMRGLGRAVRRFRR